MLKLRADEHRYLVTATGVEEALVRRIPGCRFVASLQALQLPRQPGTIIALDHMFGADQWEHVAELAQEVSETRSRQVAPAQQPATVTLVGNELSVECAFADNGLVKVVPGYRWSGPQRRWFLPASPMALDLLREHFGAQLVVGAETAEHLALKRRDEEAAVERAREAAKRERLVAVVEVASALRAEEQAEPVTPKTDIRDEPEPAAEPDPLLNRLDRLAGAIEELAALLRGGLVATASEPELDAALPEPEDPDPVDDVREPSATDWRDLLGSLERDAREVRDQANRMIQTTAPENESPLRIVSGLAMVRLGEYQESLVALRRGLEHPGGIDEDLEREALLAYRRVVLAMISAECGPSKPLLTEEDFRDRLRDELINDSGFADESLGSAAARTRLDYLVNDPVLRRVAPQISDYCRITHLLGVARGGQWMAATRIADILKERTLGEEGFAFALILLANALYEGASIQDWDKAWPRENVQETLEDLSWLVTGAEARLRRPELESSIAEAAALACLACVAGGPLEWASMSQRRVLVQLVSLRHAARREYAEFLAAFQPAANGQKSVLGILPGWTKVLAQTSLSRSAPYLMDVAANDNGGSGSLTWAVTEAVYLQALEVWGVDDAQTQIIDLLDLLEGGKRPDNYLNEVGRLVENPELAWTRLVNREQRKTIYRRALEVSLKQGHDRDSLEAFDRLVRELRAEGTAGREELVGLCVRLRNGMKALRGPALEVLLGMQLEDKEPFEDTAAELLRLTGQYQEALHEFGGLAEMFPKFREYIRADIEKRGLAIQIDLGQKFPGKRILVVGGHEWLRSHAKPVLEDDWQINVEWLSPEQAERGPNGPGIARSADLVVINAACIGHAASGRIIAAAKAAETPFVAHQSRGIGALLSFVQKTLAASAANA